MALTRSQEVDADIREVENAVVVTGGALKDGETAVLVLRTIGDQRFWTVRCTCSGACRILTGIPTCYRPLAGLRVWATIKKAIEEARALAGRGLVDQRDEEEEDNFTMCGEHAVDAAVAKRPRRERTSDRPIVLAIVPQYPDMPLPTMTIVFLNNVKNGVGIEFSQANLRWLRDHVKADLMEAARQRGGRQRGD